MHQNPAQPKAHIFTEFMRLHMINSKQTSADIEDIIMLDRHLVDQLASGELRPVKTPETIKRFAKLFQIPEPMAMALIDGDEGEVSWHLQACAELIMRAMIG